jgi:rare lipoprotein A
MRHGERAASGMLVAAMLGALLSTVQAQSSDFDARFYFPPDRVQPKKAEPDGPRNPIGDLLIPPAEAEPAPITPPAVQESSGPDPNQTSKNSSLQKPQREKPIAVGRAAYYEHSGRSANGEIYNPDKLTAAHKSLALGTRLRVVNLRTKKAVIVEVTDRSPAKMRFAIDLSRGSARAIGITKRDGTAMVAVYRVNE